MVLVPSVGRTTILTGGGWPNQGYLKLVGGLTALILPHHRTYSAYLAVFSTTFIVLLDYPFELLGGYICSRPRNPLRPNEPADLSKMKNREE